LGKVIIRISISTAPPPINIHQITRAQVTVCDTFRVGKYSSIQYSTASCSLVPTNGI